MFWRPDPISTDQSPAVSAQHCQAGFVHAIWSSFANRSFRVIILIALIAAMSMVDLYLTILYVTHSGMNEINPLARAMMDYQSPVILGLWKAATVSLGVGILALIRHKRSAEFGAWIGCLILGFLMSHWVGFIHEHALLNEAPFQVEAMADPSWIHIESDILGSPYSPIHTPSSVIP